MISCNYFNETLKSKNKLKKKIDDSQSIILDAMCLLNIVDTRILRNPESVFNHSLFSLNWQNPILRFDLVVIPIFPERYVKSL